MLNENDYELDFIFLSSSSFFLSLFFSLFLSSPLQTPIIIRDPSNPVPQKPQRATYLRGGMREEEAISGRKSTRTPHLGRIARGEKSDRRAMTVAWEMDEKLMGVFHGRKKQFNFFSFSLFFFPSPRAANIHFIHQPSWSWKPPANINPSPRVENPRIENQRIGVQEMNLGLRGGVFWDRVRGEKETVGWWERGVGGMRGGGRRWGGLVAWSGSGVGIWA